MTTRKLVLGFLFMSLVIAPLFCFNSSPISFGRHNRIMPFSPQLTAIGKDRPMEFDITKAFYMPEEWVDWYRLYAVGCTTSTEEDMENSDWVLAYNTYVTRIDGKPVSATSTDYTENPNMIGRVDYTYTANSLNQPATITSLYFSNNQWKNYRRQTYTYNEYGGILLVDIEEYFDDRGWVLVEKAVCQSTMDRLTQVTLQAYDFDLLIWFNLMHMTLTWNGDIIEEVIEQNWEENAWQNSCRIQYAYTVQDQGLQVTIENWYDNPGLWMGYERSTFTFVDGLWTEELIESYSQTYAWLPDWKGVMSYNPSGFPTFQMGYEWGNNDWVVSERVSFTYEGSAVQDDNTPGVALVIFNYPNPFVENTTVSYKLPQSSQTELSIYNIRGQLIRKLVHEPLARGQHTVTWDGKDDNGYGLASGMYLCRISSAGKQETHKMLLMK